MGNAFGFFQLEGEKGGAPAEFHATGDHYLTQHHISPVLFRQASCVRLNYQTLGPNDTIGSMATLDGVKRRGSHNFPCKF